MTFHGHRARKRFGQHRIRICRHCGAHELTDQATLKRAWQVGSLILNEPIQCDPYHREVAKEVGLKYLPYKCQEQWSEEDFKRAELEKDPPALDAETVKRAVEATEGGGE